jgi:hypothetical protein
MSNIERCGVKISYTGPLVVGVCTVNYMLTRGRSLYCNGSFIAFVVSQFEYNFYLG